MAMKFAFLPRCVLRCGGSSLSSEAGQDLVEYVLLILGIALAIVGAMGVFGGDLRAVYEDIGTLVASL